MRRARRKPGPQPVLEAASADAQAAVASPSDLSEEGENLPLAIAPPGSAAGAAGMPPAGTLARGRGRLLSDEGAGEFLFEFGALRYLISVGPRETPSPLLRLVCRRPTSERWTGKNDRLIQ